MKIPALLLALVLTAHAELTAGAADEHLALGVDRAGDHAARRPLAFYDAVGRRLAMQGGSR